MAAGMVMAGCASAGQEARGGQADAAQGTASATLRDAAGATKGTATFRQTGGGVQMQISATSMTPGPKGLHFHMTGKCDAPDFTTAGAHWNPTGMKHGKDSGAGPHMGDLPNIEIGANGTGSAETTVAGATLTGGATPLLDADGAAIIIHAGPDDYRTDPSGNSGGRIACGVITAG
jgi:Cu-Zn family superoxide dismutase